MRKGRGDDAVSLSQVAFAMTQSVTLPARLDLPAATPLADTLRGLRGKDLALNGQNISLLGTNCLQVLISASRSWEADGKSLTMVDMSETFTSHLAQFGLSLDDLTNGA
jgi:chemotaxis protein CheX